MDAACSPRAIEVDGADQPGGEFTYDGAAAPEVPHRVAVLAVPLAPGWWEVPQLVAIHLADIPGFGEPARPRDHRILLHQVKEGGPHVHVVLLPGERRGEVEPEPVHMHLRHPVPQRLHDELQDPWAGHIRPIPTRAVVEVAALVGVGEPVVGGVVNAAERQRCAPVVALRGVVVHHVQDDLDARLVQRLDHRLELTNLPARHPGGGIAVVRSEERDRVVAPVVGEAPVGQLALWHQLVDRQ